MIVSKHEVPQLTLELAETCATLADDIAAKHGTEAHLPPLVGLNMSHTFVIQSFELLDYYYDRWGNIEPRVVASHGARQTREEAAQRVSLVQKSAFILSMSAFEAAAKTAMRLPGFPIAAQSGRVYLKAIINASLKAKLIDKVDSELWEFAIELRNCMVHNNAVADRSMSLDLGDGFSIMMVAGQMTQSSPRRSILLQKAVILAYSRWCSAVLSAINLHHGAHFEAP